MRARRLLGSALAVLGESLLTLGVLLGLFAVWQLWWTDVVAARGQAEVVAGLGWADVDLDDDDGVVPTPHTDLADAPVLPEPQQATTFATLLVPRWGADYERPVSQGVDRSTVLDELGIGHYPGTAMPGDVGNVALAGHRVTYGKPFNQVEELRTGDALVIRTEAAWYVYRVTTTSVVPPEEVSVIAPVPGDPVARPTERLLTLTTCHPMFSARERFIVHGALERWQPASAGTPTELGEA